MNYLTRLIGYSVLLLLVFLAAVLAAQGWLHRQTQGMRLETIAAKRAQFVALAPLLAPAGRDWNAADAEKMGALVGGRVTLHRSAPAAPGSDTGLLYFDQPVEAAGTSPLVARVVFPLTPLSRLLMTYQRITVGLLLLGIALLATGVFFAALHRRGATAPPFSYAPHRVAQAEIGSLAQLAETTAAQSAALSQERGVRRLAEEDALLKERLLHQELEGKARLGHDLHDGIIQSLYASGLTIESARALIATAPAEADRRLAQCVDQLNATIRDVRAYIGGLAPEQLRRAGFAQAIESLVAELSAGRIVGVDLQVDEEATAQLSPEQRTEALQVAREAISNSLRHGGASLLTVRLHRSSDEVCVLVQDNGTGFDAAGPGGSGFGLGNMRARAQRIGGSVRVESRTGGGTRVILTLPVMSPA
jgi:signal transduction histidine kinase